MRITEKLLRTCFDRFCKTYGLPIANNPFDHDAYRLDCYDPDGKPYWKVERIAGDSTGTLDVFTSWRLTTKEMYEALQFAIHVKDRFEWDANQEKHSKAL